MQNIHKLLARIPARKLVGQSFLYLMVNVAAAFGPLALIPFLTRVLNPESYGIYGNFLAGMGVCSVLLGLNMDMVVRRHGRENAARLMPWVHAALVVTAVLTCGAALALMLAGRALPALPLALGVPLNYLPLMVLCGGLMVVYNLASFVATMREKIGVYALIRVGGTALFVVLAFVLFLGTRQVVGDVLLARVLSLMMVAVFGLWWLRRLGVFHLRQLWPLAQGPLRKGLAYGIPLVPAVFFDPMMSFINRVVLTHQESLAAAGQYAVAFQLAQPLQLLAGSLSIALFPPMVAWYDENTVASRRKLALTATAALAVMLAAWFGYAVLALPWLLPYIGSAAYAQAAPLVAPLALAFVVGGFASVLSNRYLHNGRTWWISLCCVAGEGVNLGLCLAMPTQTGVTWALVAGYVTLCGLLLAGMGGEKIRHKSHKFVGQ